MPLLQRIPVKYFRLIPAILFAVIGGMDIGADLLAGKLTASGFFVNLILFTPLLPFRIVWKVFGFIACLCAMYGYFALLVFLSRYLNGQPMRYPFDTFIIGPIFMTAILLAGLSLIYAGRRAGRAKVTPVKE